MLGDDPVRDVQGQPGLADPAHAGQRDRSAAQHRLTHPGDVLGAADQLAAVRGKVVQRRELYGGSAGGRLVPDDRHLQLAELRRGVQTQFLGECRAVLAVHPKGLRRSPSPVQGAHQLMARAFRQWIRRQHRFESPDRLVVLPEGQGGLDPIEDGRPPELEPSHLAADELLVAELAERRPVPQRQRLVEQLRGLCGHLVQAIARRMDQPIEASGVNGVGVHLERVAGHASDDPDGVDGAGRPDRGSQPRHQVVHRARRIGRQITTPQHIAEPTDRHDLPGVHQEHGEQPADPWPPVQGGFAARAVEFHGPEHPDPDGHVASVPGTSRRISSCAASSLDHRRGTRPGYAWRVPGGPSPGDLGGSAVPLSGGELAADRARRGGSAGG